VKYTPARGSIRITAAPGSARGRRWGDITVADDGPGISPEQLQEIFEPYVRLPGAETDAPDGAGLGLAISRELVRHMGGTLEVESQPGGGSAFTVRLPLAAGPET
jgi:two-component system, NarL family, sensor histidine kinase EvgS